MPKKKTTTIETSTDPEVVPQFVPKEETAEPVEVVETVEPAVEETAVTPSTPTKARRGRKYMSSRSRVDKTKLYSLEEAVKLIKELSYSKFAGSVEAHLQIREVGAQATVAFPHSTGRSVRVAIVSEEVLDEINKGIINFDVLLAKPADMKLLTKFARVLGPKGLMPNPKNGTLTPKPEVKKKELEAGAVTVKTERKAPLIHQVVGKTSLSEAELQANIEALLKAFTNKVVKLYICASMSPSVRVIV